MNIQLPLGSILVGVDGSAASFDALAWAVAEAVLERRPLIIANASGSSPSLLGDSLETVQHRQIRRIRARRIVDQGLKIALDTSPTLRVKALVRPTSATSLLLGLAPQAHLLVVGSRGLGPIGSVALGSVSVAVASGANSPVVVVRTPGETLQTARIVVGADGTSASAGALEFAFAQASKRCIPLLVLHSASSRDFRADRPEVLLAESMAGLREKYVDVRAETRIVTGSPVERLIEASRDADLVVVGARGHHLPGASFLGSVSQNVVERAACSVAVIHPRTQVP